MQYSGKIIHPHHSTLPFRVKNFPRPLDCDVSGVVWCDSSRCPRQCKEKNLKVKPKRLPETCLFDRGIHLGLVDLVMRIEILTNNKSICKRS